MLNGVVDNRPEVPIVILTFSFACEAERLARVSSANNVWFDDCSPVNVFDVSMVDYLRPMFF
jgi:hypothetical protein